MKARVITIITQQLSYNRCDDVVKVKEFDESEPISKIREYIESLEHIQMEGTLMSNVNIEFIKED